MRAYLGAGVGLTAFTRAPDQREFCFALQHRPCLGEERRTDVERAFAAETGLTVALFRHDRLHVLLDGAWSWRDAGTPPLEIGAETREVRMRYQVVRVGVALTGF